MIAYTSVGVGYGDLEGSFVGESQESLGGEERFAGEKVTTKR